MVVPDYDEYWMMRALELADQAKSINEIPVGAVIVKDNQLIASGFNQSILTNDPSAHAEMLAVREAGKVLNNYRLVGCKLYVTLEPCPMCAGLLVHSRLDEVIFGAADLKTGACGSVMNLVQHEQLNHKLNVRGGVLADLCGKKLSDFFKKRRAEIKKQKQQKRLQLDLAGKAN
ncbi:tRNA-specific adenosine deaminase [Catenovulum agarivorans DS-2]|uniref:tRNA-specific adenosine deaminase n=2 Tax=Catenovulum agarivorans TaxID=1172192 RepID=W7QTW1_9ALTE|nr:tRNA-specific adenosine deaminase [Catenovulum agarivorans DS-2]